MWSLHKFRKRRTESRTSLVSHTSGGRGERPPTDASAVTEADRRTRGSNWNDAEAGDRYQICRDASPHSKPGLINAAPSSLPPGNVPPALKSVSQLDASSPQKPKDVSVVSKPVSPNDAPGSSSPDDVTAVPKSGSPPVAPTSQQVEGVLDVYKPVSTLPATSLHLLDGDPPVKTHTQPARRVSVVSPELMASREPRPMPDVKRISRVSLTSIGKRFSLYTDIADLRSGFTSAFAQSTITGATGKTTRFAQHLRQMENKATTFLCGILLLVLCLLAILLLKSKHGRGEGGRLCASQDCMAHRMLLHSALDKSVDPCQDFDAFVCPHRKAYSKDATFMGAATSTISVMHRRWLDGLQELLKQGERVLGAGRKAAAMYNACMTENRSTNDAVMQFMKMLGLRWLEPHEPETSAFGLLLNIAYNWQAPLWFRVAVLPPNTYHPVLRVFISRNPQMAEWHAELEAFNGTEHYRRRWSDAESVRASERLISQHLETRMNIFRMFLGGNVSPTETPRQFSLGDASNHANFASNMTLLLNQHIKPNWSFSSKDMMIFEEARLLEASNAVFARYENKELLQHVCWLFRDVYGPIADPSRLLSDSLGIDANKTRLRYCSFVVEASYQLLVNALFAVTRLTPADRESIDGLLSAVQQEAVQLVRDADWLEWRSQSIAIAKLEGIKTLLWPRGELLTEGGLFEIYRLFPDRATSFSGYWLQTRGATRNYNARYPAQCAEILGSPGIYTESLVHYSHVLNTVFISMAALAMPFFYRSGTQAMLYGGLGYQYARQIVRTLDITGIHIDAYGSVTHRWLSRASAREYYKHVTCLGAMNLYPEAPAVEVAYKAYRKAAEKQAEESKLLMKMSEAQVFFITMCLGMCHQQRGQSARACNKAVMAFRPFAEAFRCDPGSNMSVRQKCAFF